ncbi:MAG: serine/threonine protein kinase [Fimbriiglobus sp.]
MPVDDLQSFLRVATDLRLLSFDLHERLEKLNQNFDDMAWDLEIQALVDNETLTRYQADLILRGRASELGFAGYPILEVLSSTRGAKVYRALHPSLRSLVSLRRYGADAFPDPRLGVEFIEKAQKASTLYHANLAELLDANVTAEGEVYVAMVPFAGETLENLVSDIGPMPIEFAQEYALGLAEALEMVHSRGWVHGEVTPANITLGPLSPMSRPRADGSIRYRPASNATAKLFELGLLPTIGEAAGDVKGLAESLYFMLLAVKPGPEPGSICALRQDVPQHLGELLQKMLATEASDRPTISEVVRSLKNARSTETEKALATDPLASVVDAALASQSAVITPTQLISDAELDSMSGESQQIPSSLLKYSDPPQIADPVPVYEPVYSTDPLVNDVPDYNPLASTSDEAETFSPSAYESRTQLPDPARTAAQVVEAQKTRKKIYMWVAIGVGLQLFAVLLWLIYILQPFSGSGSGTNTKPPTKRNR